jgi:RimJ/RimL family protein N-acetyltransferase
MTILTTARLRLVPMADDHFDGLFAMNSDAEVMRYITGKPDTPEDTRAMIERVKARWVEWGYSWWSFFEIETGMIVGAGCIQHLGRDAANPLETGWRLRRDRWGQGYASEAAQAMAAFAFETLQAPLLTAVCDPLNTGSSHVMEKLGMHYRGIEHWYDTEVATYEMTAAQWQAHKPA